MKIKTSAYLKWIRASLWLGFIVSTVCVGLMMWEANRVLMTWMLVSYTPFVLLFIVGSILAATGRMYKS